jgi:Na+-transporting methylmalonyl-CoA/oxaloacetate decarboxylase gamma subunit
VPLNETAWIIGLAIGAGVVVAVVVLLVTIIYLAARIRRQAVEIVETLREARDATSPLWQVERTNDVVEEILAAARKARESMGG